MLDLGAAVHDNLEARSLGLACRVLVDHSELHPNPLDPEALLLGDGFADDAERGIGGAEDIDDIDGPGMSARRA